MVVGKSSRQEQEGEGMNERLGGGVEAKGRGVEGEIGCGLSKPKLYLGYLGG